MRKRPSELRECVETELRVFIKFNLSEPIEAVYERFKEQFEVPDAPLLTGEDSIEEEKDYLYYSKSNDVIIFCYDGIRIYITEGQREGINV